MKRGAEDDEILKRRHWRLPPGDTSGRTAVTDAMVLREAARIVKALPMGFVWKVAQWGDAQRAVLWGRAIDSLDDLAHALDFPAENAGQVGDEASVERPFRDSTPEEDSGI